MPAQAVTDKAKAAKSTAATAKPKAAATAERGPPRPANAAGGGTPSPASGAAAKAAANAAGRRPNPPEPRNGALAPGTKPGDVLSGLIR